MCLGSRIFVLCLSSFMAVGADGAWRVRDTVGLSWIQWTERVRAVEGDIVDRGYANYIGHGFFWDRTWTQGRWGGGVGGILSAGRMTAGQFDGLTSFTNSKADVFSAFGIHPRGFYRWTGQVQFGASLPILYRNIGWRSELKTVKVETRSAVSILPALDLRVLMSPAVEISQSLGILSLNSENYWQISLHIRL